MAQQHLRLVRRDHVPYLQASISSSFGRPDPSDAQLVATDGTVHVNR
jgi:hypothetical protein